MREITEELLREAWGGDVDAQFGVILQQQAARKFGPEIGEKLARLLARNQGPEHIDQVATAILEYDAASDLLERARGG